MLVPSLSSDVDPQTVFPPLVGGEEKKRRNQATRRCVMRKWAILFILVLCTWPALAAGQAVTGGTLIWGRGGDSVSLDLANATDGESIKAGIQVLENLVLFGKNSMDGGQALDGR